MNKLRVDFDLPTNHLKGLRGYVPPKARSSTEIERRHELPNGTLILEQQHLGSKIGGHLLSMAQDPDDIKFVTKILTAAGLNTAWYSFGQTDMVMRRRLKLPNLSEGFSENPYAQNELMLRGSYHLSEMGGLAWNLMASHIDSSSRQNKLRTSLGRAAGNAALHINCIGLAGQLEGASPYMAQELARTSCLGALERARSLQSELSYPASLSQLPDPDSDLSVHIRRSAPNNIYEAYDEAISMYAIPS
jgi:hypothetical protein